MKLLACIIVLLFAARGVQPQSPISFCDLVRNPEKYKHKEVTIRATWRYGYEWSQLYCLECLDEGRAWLEMSPDLDDHSMRALKKLPKHAAIVNLTVHGIFMSGDTYGHQNGYRFMVVASKVSDIAVIQKGMKPPAQEQRAERHWACGGTNPK
jgi:hypothetical protein